MTAVTRVCVRLPGPVAPLYHSVLISPIPRRGIVVTVSEPLPGAPAPRIAVVGCGAIARLMHLPALVRHPEVASRLVLVDRHGQRARELATEFGVARTAEDYADVLSDVDGVIVTVPHALHHRISMDCLRARKHVLCEKPLAESPDEAREMIAAAASAGVTLSANHLMRLYPVNRKIKQLIHDGAIGRLARIQFAWGEKFEWPAASGFYFGGGKAHGVLVDKGPHFLDIVCWWLGGRPEVVSVRDDSFGGGEAQMSLTLRMGDCTVDGEFSFLTRYSNRFVLEGDEGRIEGSLYDFQSLELVDRHGARRRIKAESPTTDISEFGNLMIDNFLDVVRGAARPAVSGADVLDSVALIDDCYAHRTRYVMPWHDAWRRVANA